MKNYKFLIYFLLVGLMKANIVRAGYITGSIVPCNDNCTICDLWHLGSNIINFISFNLALPVAALLFAVAGVMFLFSGGREDMVTKAKGIFVNTFIGLVVIFSSWLMIDTLLKTVAKSEFSAAWEKFPMCIQINR
ncbi:pilin [Patescibacteria group bacterium]|nr:pilin [Patescibacteria group bacterium]MCG2809634.1 pilin [Candidatus Portnoybacteria bacterium]